MSELGYYDDKGTLSFGLMYHSLCYPNQNDEPKENNADRLQLVAQAICLEEMMCTRIEEGDLYYGTTKRREHVEITDFLRQEVENICLQMHQYFDRQYTPNIKRTKSCNACSLKNICLPQLSKKKSVHTYILKTIKDGEL